MDDYARITGSELNEAMIAGLISARIDDDFASVDFATDDRGVLIRQHVSYAEDEYYLVSVRRVRRIPQPD